jgi:hypothetical protein
LDEDVTAEGHTVEPQISDGHIDLDILATAGLGNLLGKALEKSIQLGTAATFFLFGLKLVFVSIAVFSFSVSSLVKLNVSRFTIELHVLGLLLVAHDDGIFQMNVNNDNQLMLTRLEEKVFDI